MNSEQMMINISFVILRLRTIIHHAIKDTIHSIKKIMNKKEFVEAPPYDITFNFNRMSTTIVRKEYTPSR